jgi:hypothetical protein
MTLTKWRSNGTSGRDWGGCTTAGVRSGAALERELFSTSTSGPDKDWVLVRISGN